MAQAAASNDKAQPGPTSLGAGMERLLGGGGLPLDRLPALRAAFDRTALGYAEALGKTLAEPPTLTVAAVVAGRADDILQRYAGNAMFAVFDAPGWKTRMVAGLSRSFVFSLTEAQFGGDGREPPLEDDRPFSNIEAHIASHCLELVGVAMQGALSEISPLELTLETCSPRVEPTTLGKGAAVVVATLALQLLGRGGVLFLIIPQAALVPLRQRLAQDSSLLAPEENPAWTRRFKSQVGRAELRLAALLETRELTLGDVSQLRVGQVITLGQVGAAPITLACNDRALFRGQLGQSEGRYTVRVDSAVEDARTAIDELAA